MPHQATRRAARVAGTSFSDGLVRELDFTDALPGVLATIDNDEVLAGATVDAVAGTISRSNGIALDPDVLHGDDASASGVQPRVAPRVSAAADELKTAVRPRARTKSRLLLLECR